MVVHIDSTPIDHAITWLHAGMTPVAVVGIVAIVLIARALCSAFFPRRYR